MGLYLLIIVTVGVIAYFRKKSAAQHGAIQAQYSGNFGTLMLLLTTFASVFSGYTVMGVPAEASNSGYYAIRWLAAIHAINFSSLVLYPRLRRLAVLRKYRSPCDFIADRYRSELLTVLANLCACL